MNIKTNLFTAIAEYTIDNYITSLSKSVLQDIEKSNSTVKWTCFVCKTDTELSIQTIRNIDISQMYCSNCRKSAPDKHHTNPALIRYYNTFYSFIKQRILENTGIKDIDL